MPHEQSKLINFTGSMIQTTCPHTIQLYYISSTSESNDVPPCALAVSCLSLIPHSLSILSHLISELLISLYLFLKIYG